MWRGGEPRSVRRVAAAAAMEANPVAGEDSAGAEAVSTKTDPTMTVVMATVPEAR